jgi:hypothetical protein
MTWQAIIVWSRGYPTDVWRKDRSGVQEAFFSAREKLEQEARLYARAALRAQATGNDREYVIDLYESAGRGRPWTFYGRKVVGGEHWR